ncbi:MAG TPA: hypothetical protein VFA44_11395 [Gaiellaceae bacterium]|nr:hypothetical protein [Gaiellaceae bacterium]
MLDERLLLAAHLAGLGFLPLAVVGAAEHVLPMMLRVGGRPVRAWSALPLLGLGAALALAVSQADRTLGRAALALVAAGVLLVVADIGSLAARAPGTRLLLASRSAVVLAVCHAALALALGAVLLERPGREVLGIRWDRAILVHLHLAALGWLTLLILAVGRTLAPMLALAPAAPPRRLPAEELAFTAGLWLVLGGIGWRVEGLAPAGALLCVTALARFLGLLARVARTHRLDGMEGPLGHFLAGLVLLVQAAVLGFLLLGGWEATSRRLAAYVVLLLVGWAVGVTIGHVGKLLAVSLWTWWPPGPRPRQAALYPRRTWVVETALFALGVELLAAGALAGSAAAARSGAVLLLASAAVALAAAVWTLSRRGLTAERNPLAFPAASRR